ncbi:MAG: hypothetical protein H7338_23225 [Candidatus Sericytochromatia bacterium]|nr:hypothetical protein [Candidatus Sericytochromatia bacterium]
MAIINPGSKGPIGPRPAGQPAPAVRPGQPAAASPAAVPSPQAAAPAAETGDAELPEGAKSCPKCSGTMLTDNNGEFCWAVTAVVKDPEGRILYDPATGVPLAMYTCQECGYLEFYSAIKTGLFTVPAQPPQG